MAERISMAEWRPEPLFDKIQRLDATLASIEGDRNPLKARKKELELLLSEYNVQLKGLTFGCKEYNTINSIRGQVIKEKGQVEADLNKMKERIQKIHAEKEAVKLELKRKPNEAIKTSLLELRDKYLSFSADATRVSSMRSMAAKFTEEIQSLLKYFV